MPLKIVLQGGKAKLIYYGVQPKLPTGYERFATKKEAQDNKQLRRYGLIAIPKEDIPKEKKKMNKREINKLTKELAEVKGRLFDAKRQQTRENTQKDKDEWNDKIELLNKSIDNIRNKIKELRN
jgi:predicted  nucleic acid-binding Zn-ribbon protein